MRVWGFEFGMPVYGLKIALDTALDKGKVFGALFNWFVKGIWLSQSWASFCETTCVWVYFHCFKISSWLFFRRKQRAVNNLYSTWLEILSGVPQGSILAPLIFNIFLADLFFILSKFDTANYADNNMPYTLTVL